MNLQEQMLKELKDKSLFEQARLHAFEYLDGIDDREVFPSQINLEKLSNFEEPLQMEPGNALDILNQLHQFGSPATVAQAGGRYFGFVNGSAVPASLGVKWLSDIWDQNGGLFLTSPINAKLEQVCEEWLIDLFNLPPDSCAGFVSGTSMANLCGLAAARYSILKKLGWDVNENGLHAAPKIRIIAHVQVHACIKKTLAMLGFGTNNVEWIPADGQGRVIVDELPKLDASCLVLLQAGNVNTGAFDDFDTVCDLANEAGAWVHIDGAFGLWAAATTSLSHLAKGMEKASSWAVDGHKTLNTPYDSGIVLCRDRNAMVAALQSSGDYITFSENRDSMLYTPEMSKRSRGIELWATMKYLGKQGIDEMVTGFHLKAKQLEAGLREVGFTVLNEVVFNQVLVKCDTEAATKSVLEYIQHSGVCWLGGSIWNGEAAIRISVCSWKTTTEDIDRTIGVFKAGFEVVSCK